MNDKDQIKDLFSDKLGSFEAKVNPELWANVASQVGAATGAAATGGGLSLLAKAIIGVSGAAVLTTGVILWNNDLTATEPTKPSQQEITQTTDVQEVNMVQVQQASKPITLTTDKSNTHAFSQEPSGAVVSNNSPDQIVQSVGSSNVAAGGTQVIPDPVLIPTPGLLEPLEPSSIAIQSVQEARENDIKELSNNPNIATEDEPTTQVNPNSTQSTVVKEEKVTLTFPNVFTPNGDRINDEYFIESANVEFEEFEFVVYDRTGSVVMMSKDPSFRWTALNPQTGRYYDKGMYAYVMVAKTRAGTKYKKSGTITIE